MNWQLPVYLAACLLLPALWGWLVHRLFLRVTFLPKEMKLPPGQAADELEAWHYQI